MIGLVALALANTGLAPTGDPSFFGDTFIGCLSPLACYPDRVTIAVETGSDGSPVAVRTEPPLPVAECLLRSLSTWRGAPNEVRTVALSLQGRPRPVVSLTVEAPAAAPPYELRLCGVEVSDSVACDDPLFGRTCDAVVSYQPLPWRAEVVGLPPVAVVAPSARVVLPDRGMSDAERAIAQWAIRGEGMSCRRFERRLLREASRWGEEGRRALEGRPPCDARHDPKQP
jgi:hypothetical protein